MGITEEAYKRSTQQSALLNPPPPDPDTPALLQRQAPAPVEPPQPAALLRGETAAPVNTFNPFRSAIEEAASRPADASLRRLAGPQEPALLQGPRAPVNTFSPFRSALDEAAPRLAEEQAAMAQRLPAASPAAAGGDALRNQVLDNSELKARIGANGQFSPADQARADAHFFRQGIENQPGYDAATRARLAGAAPVAEAPTSIAGAAQQTFRQAMAASGGMDPASAARLQANPSQPLSPAQLRAHLGLGPIGPGSGAQFTLDAPAGAAPSPAPVEATRPDVWRPRPPSAAAGSPPPASTAMTPSQLKAWVAANPPAQVQPPAPAPAAAPAAIAEQATVAPNRTPSKPASNPIVNPNVAKGVLSAEAEAFQNSGAGQKIPAQVGNPKVNPVPPQGVQPASGAPKRVAGAGAPVPNMPANTAPVAKPVTGGAPPPPPAGGSAAYRAGQAVRPVVNALPGKLATAAGAAGAGLAIAPYYHAITDENNGMTPGQRLKMAADATWTGLGTIAGGAVGGGLGTIGGPVGAVAGGLGGAYLANQAFSGVAGNIRQGLNYINEKLGGSPDYITSVADDMKKAGYNPTPDLAQTVVGNPRQAQPVVAKNAPAAAPVTPAAPAKAKAAPAAAAAAPSAAPAAPTAPIVPVSVAPQAARNPIADAARQNALEQLDLETRNNPNAVISAAKAAGQMPAYYITADGRTITPPAPATAQDRQLAQKVSVLDNIPDQTNGTGASFTVEKDGKKYTAVPYGYDAAGQSVYRGVAVEGRDGLEQHSAIDTIRRYDEAAKRLSGMSPEDAQTVAGYHDREQRRRVIEAQYQHALAGGAPAQPASQGSPQGPVQQGPVQQAVAAEAQRQGYDPQLALTKMSLETGGKFNLDAKNPDSTAQGLGQLLAKNRAQYGTDEQWKDPQFAMRSTIDFMRKQDADLGTRMGRPLTPTESYLGHLLGPTGGAALLGADPKLPIEQVVSSYEKNPKKAAQIVNNNDMAGLTAGEAVAKWQAKVNQHMAALGYAGAAPAAPAAANGAPSTIAAAANAAVLPPIENHDVEVTQRGQTTIHGFGKDGGPQAVHFGGNLEAYRAATEKALARQPDLAQRMTVKQGVPLFDNVEVPANVLAGGGKAIDAYLDSVNQSANYAANPVGAKLAEAAVAPTIQGKAHVEAARVAAEAAEQNQRFITAGGGVDPTTYTPLPTSVFDKKTQTWVEPRAKPKPTRAVATAQAQAAVKAGADKEAVNATLQSYGYPPIN